MCHERGRLPGPFVNASKPFEREHVRLAALGWMATAGEGVDWVVGIVLPVVCSRAGARVGRWLGEDWVTREAAAIRTR
jgi:hypothetical protein